MIDAHVHVWTDDTTRYPRAAGQQSYAPAHFTPEDLFRHSKPAGVTRIVLIQMSFYRFDNTYMLDAMRDHPGVFSGVGIVNVAGRAPGEDMRNLARHGVRGFRITKADGLESPGMEQMWRTAAREGLVMCPLVSPDSLPVIDRMCEKHPETTVVIDHLARIGAGGPVRDADIRLLSGLARHRLVNVKASAFYALGSKTVPYRDLAPLIRRVFEDYGPRRMMWASDCPFQVEGGHTYADSINLVRNGLSFLGKEDKEWLLGKTAERVFFSPRKK